MHNHHQRKVAKVSQNKFFPNICIFSIRFFGLILLFFVYCSLFIAIASAEDPKEEYKKLQREIETHKDKIEKTRRLEDSILEEIERINKDIAQVHEELRKHRGKLKITENKIRKVATDISVNKIKLEKQNGWLKRKLRTMQKHGYSGDIILLLSTSVDLSQLMRRWRYIKALTLYDHGMLEEYKETLRNLTEQEKRLKSLRAELKEIEEDIEVNAATISERKREKEMLLSSVRKEKSSYEDMLRELKEASNRLLEIIRRSEEISAKGFRGLKGKLQWPVNGKIIIPYGTQKDPQFNTPVFRNGIHIKAGEDTTAKAVYTGKVVFAEWFKGYGQLIIISHGEGYHTLYANLAEIFSAVGDIIKEQQPIGRVGESGTLDVSGLYFEIRYKGKSLDPTQWLRRR